MSFKYMVLIYYRANQETSALTGGSSMVNLPSAIDFYLEKEIQKAAVMVNGFKTTFKNTVTDNHHTILYISLIVVLGSFAYFTIRISGQYN